MAARAGLSDQTGLCGAIPREVRKVWDVSVRDMQSGLRDLGV